MTLPPILDAHEDIANDLIERDRDFESPDVPAMITLPLLERAGVKIIFATLYQDPKYRPDRVVEAADRQVAKYRTLSSRFGKRFAPLRSMRDLHQAESGDGIGFTLLMEGADPIETLGDVQKYYDAGVRIVGPVWKTNRFASSASEEGSLTEDGKELLGEMGRLGIALDVSHLNEESFWAALENFGGTVIASHSNSAEIFPHPRNLSNDQIRAIAERGGVIGIILFAKFISQLTRPPLSKVEQHLRHILEVGGEDAVGIGSDFDGGFTAEDAPKGLDTIGDLPRLYYHLLDAGLDNSVLRKVFYGNFRRILGLLLKDQGLPT